MLISAKVTNFSLLDTNNNTHKITQKKECLYDAIHNNITENKKNLSEYNNFSIINILNLNFLNFFMLNVLGKYCYTITSQRMTIFAV